MNDLVQCVCVCVWGGGGAFSYIVILMKMIKRNILQVSSAEILIMVNLDLVLWECSLGTLCVCLLLLLHEK